jgi:hypothetical protein
MLVRIIVGFCGHPLDIRGYLTVRCGCRSGIQHPQSADADMTLASNGADLPQPSQETNYEGPSELPGIVRERSEQNRGG